MKKALFSLTLALFAVIGLVGCDSNSPEAAADKFMTGLLHYDYEAAKSVSTEETKKMVDLMAQFSAMMPDSMKKEAKKIKVNIKDSKEEGETAVVTYTTSEDPAEKKMNLVKQDGKWLVQYTKMDEGNGTESMPPADEVPTSDTATTASADGTAVDTAQPSTY